MLTVNQVFDILIGWCETKDWKQALARGFPTRKLRHAEERAEESKQRVAASAGAAAAGHDDDDEDEDEAFNVR